MKAQLKMKPQDTQAATVEFGIEIETAVPADCGFAVGAYHVGHPVRQGRDATTGEVISAPAFEGNCWRAEQDGSIQCPPGYRPCEFVSPVLKGDAGVAALIDMVAFMNRIGAKVNHSCGCHVTVGIKSVIGSSDNVEIARFVRKLTSLAKQNAWAIYAQTGTDRHLNHYAHQLNGEVGHLLEEIVRAARQGRPYDAASQARRCGRGMVNLCKAFNGERSAIEFRAFAGTLNIHKVLHHVATALGMMRKAHVSPCRDFGTHPPIRNGQKALRRMWRVLGWAFVKRSPVTYGLFGTLYMQWNTYRKTALVMARKFDGRFPDANL